MQDRLELWVGAECTINRVGDRWRDQALLTGLRHRADDIDRLAALGARRVRLPVLWEHVERQGDGSLDFEWPDRAIARLREWGIEPILGLLHHGSGPHHTNLLDDRFAHLFADYALRVAERYPDQRCWTPVNEPLTTARFSCLYGVWYPHHRSDHSFVRALLNQVKATVLAMRAIRTIIPDAELVQTDDLGFTRCTPGLADQAAFDNERRWLAFDLLCGRVDEHHPLRDWLRDCGAGDDELDALASDPCAPDIMGINAYVTSERFLDERLHLYPVELHGGNGRQAYVDIETARVDGQLIDGFAGRLREAHDRYGLPLAITEVHMGCTREEQMRWLHQAWQAALAARRDGIDVRAVTAWAAFGTVDWSSLLTEERGHYEPGLWDVRGGAPRLTALGRLARTLASGEDPEASPQHPMLASPGWWQRDLRLRVDAHGSVVALPAQGDAILIVGDGGLAATFARLCHMRGLPYERIACPAVDMALAGLVSATVSRGGFWAVIDASGNSLGSARRADAAAQIASACGAAGTRLLVVSADPAPCDPGAVDDAWQDMGGNAAHARCEALEEAFLCLHPKALVVRTSSLFGPWHHDHALARELDRRRQGLAGHVPRDAAVTPTYLPDLAQASLDLLVDGEAGAWLLTHGQTLDWGTFAMRAGASLGIMPPAAPDAVCALGYPARPERVDAAPACLLPSLDDAMARYPRDHEAVPGPIPELRAVRAGVHGGAGRMASAVGA